MDLRVRGVIRSGEERLDVAISDLEYVNGPDGPMLVSVAGAEGGVATYMAGAGALPAFRDSAFFGSPQVNGSGARLVMAEFGGVTQVCVSGVRPDGLLSYSLDGSGALGRAGAMTGDALGAAPDVVATTAGGDMVLAASGEQGFSIHQLGNDGTLTGKTRVADTDATHAAEVGDMATVRIGESDVLVVASRSEHGVSAYTLDGPAPSAGGRMGPSEGLGIMVPTDIETAEIDGAHYVVVASAPAAGESGALSVMRIDADGALRPTDHVIDTRDSRFGKVQAVQVVQADGHVFVIAGGGDGGLSLFELLPHGRLVHLDSIAGTDATRLDDISALEIAAEDGDLQVFAARESGQGIAVLTADMSGRGETLIAPGAGGAVAGGALDDILVDRGGADTLTGGAGADRFVLSSDGTRDRITDFDPAMDVLDLSGLPFLYDADRLDIRQTDDGAVITHRDETIALTSADGAPLDPEAVRAAVDLSIHHGHLPPDPALQIGSPFADAMSGSGADDTIRGKDGDDTLEGQAGRDVLDGGAGDDILFGGNGHDTLSGNAGADLLKGNAGDDMLRGGGGNDILVGHGGRDSLDGEAGHDTLRGGGGDDTLDGGGGDDVIRGGAGDDVIRGGEGDDVISGGDGDDVLIVGAGADTFVFNTPGASDTLPDADPLADGLDPGRAVPDAEMAASQRPAGAARDPSSGLVARLDGAEAVWRDGYGDVTALETAFMLG
jgi:Ca2+-binding RTX toxin-like protein